MELLQLIAAVVALFVIIAPLGCWMALNRIEKLLKERLPKDGEQLAYGIRKQTQYLQDIKEEGLSVDVRSVQKKSPA